MRAAVAAAALCGLMMACIVGQADGHMGKDSGWNLLSSDRLVPKAAPNNDAAWEASDVFFPTSMASAARPRDRSSSPTSTQVPSRTPAAFTSCAIRAPAFPAFHQCGLRRPLRAELRSTFSKGSARRHLVQRMASLTMSSGSASSVPSWEHLFERLPLNKRRAATKSQAQDNGPVSAAAAAAAAYVGAGGDINMEVILTLDPQCVNPGCRRVLLALLEKGMDFKPVFARSPDEQLPELVLGDRLVSGWDSCLMALEESVQRAPLLPYDKQQREIALEMMRSTVGLMPDADIASMWGPKKSRETMERLEKIESVLAAADGDFFLGDTFSMVDIALFPALEACNLQAAILMPALSPSANPKFPSLGKWYTAMDQRVASYRSRVKADTFSAARQLALDDPALSKVGLESATKALADEGWKGVMAEPAPPSWIMFAERFPSVAKHPKTEAAAYLYAAREALRAEAGRVVPECVSGARRPRVEDTDGSRKDMVDRTLRLLMCALLEAPDYGSSPTFANTFIATMIEDLNEDELTEVKEVLVFLRECVRVPRDMGEQPARRWRAHAGWLGAEVRKLLKKLASQSAADAPKALRSRY